MANETTFDFESAKWDRDLSELMRRLEAVLAEIGDAESARYVPWASEGALPERVERTRNVQVLSLSFQLLNMIEENTANQSRRRRERAEDAEPEDGLWDEVLGRIAAAGHGAADVREHMARVEIVPTLTAHPTEAKRETVLEHHRRLYLNLVKLENQMWTPGERASIHEEIDASIERLLRTGEVFFEKPDIESEARNVLHYLGSVFPEVLLEARRRFVRAWRERFGTGEQVPPSPRCRFGSWVGGDRDGHPFVTTAVTRKVLGDLRREALSLLDGALGRLGSVLSFSSRLQPEPESLRALLSRNEGRNFELKNPDEPWREAVNRMRSRIPWSEGEEGVYGSPDELVEDLVLLEESLTAVRAERIAQADVAPVRELVQCFGFHLASLDVRQNSAYLERAVAQMLEASRVHDADFGSWEHARRRELLTEELLSRRPLLRRSTSAGPEADEMRALLRTLFKATGSGRNLSAHVFIVSMTRDASDLLAAHLLAKEADYLVEQDGELACPIPVVPLFETRSDLQASPGIMEEYLAHPYVRRSLELVRKLRGDEQPIQEVMLGYSDSCKDAGIIASSWGLYEAQERILEVGERTGVAIRFFHGRGGTISRGAGPMHRFLSALPPGSLRHGVRVTEQGETIAQKYANKLTASYHIEVLTAGAIVEGLLADERQPIADELRAVMDELAERSAQCYAELLHTEGFVSFYRQATPLDVIEHSRIGSRPSRRHGAQTLEDLRAIPWVFSWNQARFFLPGWFGAGTALDSLRRERPECWALLQSGLRSSPTLYYLFANIETTLHSANEELFRAYSDLVGDRGLRERFVERIAAEYRTSREALDALFAGPFAERRPRMAKTLDLREEPLRTLHRTQIEHLRRWRQGGAEDGVELDDLLLITNAIASGLRTTG